MAATVRIKLIAQFGYNGLSLPQDSSILFSALRRALWILASGSVGITVWFFSAWPEWIQAIASGTALAFTYLFCVGLHELWNRSPLSRDKYGQLERNQQKIKEAKDRRYRDFVNRYVLRKLLHPDTASP